MTSEAKTITYDFTLLPGNPDAVCLNEEFTRMYVEYFPLMKLLYADTVLEPGAYRVVITYKDDTASMTITRVYYY